ncbi:hypothetical protein C8F01DRAFT_1078895 [Mycena amicta]|nr:hypothetical protein C8F01DRAFT_1078895 [Mycena amicta]
MGVCRECPPNHCLAMTHHDQAAHSPLLRALASRGPCAIPDTVCNGFQGDLTGTVQNPACDQCRQPYTSHACLGPGGNPPAAASTSFRFSSTNSRPSTALVPSLAPSASSWTPSAQRAHGNSAQHRQSQIHHQNAWGTATGSLVPRAAHRSFSQNQKRPAPSSSGISQPEVAEIRFGIVPLPVAHQPEYVDYENLDLYPTVLRLAGIDSSELYLALEEHNLTFTLRLPSNPPPGSAPVYIQIHEAVMACMALANATFTVTSDRSQYTNLTDYSAITSLDHVRNYQLMPWTLASVGNKPRGGSDQGTVISRAPLSAANMNFTAFQALTGTTIKPVLVPYPFFLIAPTYGPLRGPQAKQLPEIYGCFPLRVLHTTQPQRYHQGCLGALCPPNDDPDSEADAREVPSLSAVWSARQASPDPLFFNDPDITPFTVIQNLREEEEHLRRALQESAGDLNAASQPLAGPSRQPTAGPSRQPTAGPSRQPMAGPSRRPVSRVLPRTPSPDAFQERPSNRRRLMNFTSNPPTIDLTTPPRTHFSGTNSFNNHLKISADEASAVVDALCKVVASFYGGDPYIPGDGVNEVKFETSNGPAFFEAFNAWTPDQFDLFTIRLRVTYSGSAGTGVRTALLTNLMTKVFEDRSLWVRHGEEETCVLRIPHGMNQPSPIRLRTLRVYGFLCRLYIIQEECLPSQLSTMLAFWALADINDDEFLMDDALIQKLDPLLASQFDDFPTSFSEYRLKVALDGPTAEILKAYTIDIENQTVTQFIAECEIEPAQFDLAVKRYRNRVLFNTVSSLQQSPQAKAFSEGLNAAFSHTSDRTLGQSMGIVEELIPHLTGRRITTVQQVLELIHWQSAGNAALHSQEAQFRTAFEHYLTIPGIVSHRLLSPTLLSDAEQQIHPDSQTTRAAMFVRFVTGMQQLPLDRITIQFFEHFPGEMELGPDGSLPDGWPDRQRICAVKARVCTKSVEVSLRLAQTLLQQPIPEDHSATDFDLLLYLSFRPITDLEDFGGLI